MEKELETKELFEERDNQGHMPFGGILHYIAGAGETIPHWWSQSRDIALRNFVKEGDHLSSTVNTLHDMMITIPYKIVPRDTTIKTHIKRAEEYERRLYEDTSSRSNLASSGWGVGFGAFVNDYHCTDNGGWLIADDGGPSNKPLMSEALRLIHLDSNRVWRTGSQEFPAIFHDINGSRHVIHHSRIINLTSNPDPAIEMYGIGYCAVSRSVKAAQNLMDIANYKLEKLGSRPKRAIMTINTEGQQRRAVQAVQNALEKADMTMDTRGLNRFSMIPIVGVNGEITLLDLASLPDGFNETESTQLGIFVLALAFGVDVRQLGFALGVSGQTKADAEVQHLKMRGKGPGTILQETERLINARFLPDYLRIVFDWQDDSQDLMQADIQSKRSGTRKANLETGSTTVRVEREKMVENNEITTEQFEQMELSEGRLSDGTNVLALFESTDRRIQEYLDLGIDDPLDVEINDPALIVPEIKAAIADLQQLILASRDLERTRPALAALENLMTLYQKPETQTSERETLNASQARGVREILVDLKAGNVAESTAISLIVGVGIDETQAQEMVRAALEGQSTQEVIEDVTDAETTPTETDA